MKRILCLPLILLFFGCAEDKTRPADMPPLVDCTVRILSEEQPLSGVTVEFHHEDHNFKWGASGVTDANGNARMVTYGRFFGVVEGKYVVTVSKLERDEFDPENPPRHVRVYTLTDAQYTDPRTTPLQITVSGRMTETFDVGKTGRNVLRIEDAQ